MVSVHGSRAAQDVDSFFRDPVQQRSQVVYAKQTRERQVFMQDLKEYRRQIEIRTIKKMRKLVGPRWYQVLSVPQRQALDRLDAAIYQDLLEGRPIRTSRIMHKIGLFPPPKGNDLMSANEVGFEDGKKMMAHLFYLYYGHTIEGKRNFYSLNARLILSSIYYLGLKNLIELLREKFEPDHEPPKKQPKPKPKQRPPVPSPYLEKYKIPMWYPASPKKFKPAPLPNLEELNEPYVEGDEYRIQVKPLPPPPPPPPPANRVPRALCDKLAGVFRIDPNSQVTAVAMKTTTTSQRSRNTNVRVEVKKKTYGICITRPDRKSLRRKLKAPSTGVKNAQFMIQGVYKISGRTVFVLGSITITPAEGELIHGGFTMHPSGYMNIHCGFRGYPADPPPDPCDCLKKWQGRVLQYVQQSKCYCGHHYDYGNEGAFPPDELRFFEKPTPGSTFKFNYDTIFDTNEKQLFVKKKMKKIWETDSVIGTKKDQSVKKKEKKISSKTCLGSNPKPWQYLKCVIRWLRGVNVAARLPDVWLAPELVEWMRRRIFGPFRPDQRRAYLRQSRELQTCLEILSPRILGPLITKHSPQFMGASTWVHKFTYRDKFNKYSDSYRRQLFKLLANINNVFWRVMFQPEFPDKKFREIFFSYLSATTQDLMLMRPYSTAETQERKDRLNSRRVVCLPDGYEPKT